MNGSMWPQYSTAAQMKIADAAATRAPAVRRFPIRRATRRQQA